MNPSYGINFDNYKQLGIKKLKGDDRPINNQEKRLEQLQILPWVDAVVIFDDDTPLNAIKKVNPDIIVKGGDYTVETTVGILISVRLIWLDGQT